MARYTGPKTKIARRFNEPIFGPSKALQKKGYPPGQHGRSRRRKQSEYAVQLLAKQKAKYTYGVLERQFSNLFQLASRKQGVTGENLLRFLEARLDNVVFRLGIAPTRRAARQLVGHKHVIVNGEIVNIPSFSVKPGDKIGVREKSKSLQAVTESLQARAASRSRFNWLEWNAQEMEGTFVTYPERDQIPENIQEQLIIELYSK
ncbi:MAG: 30S ribosomal protein S4 [Catalinimonas sp.]